MTRNLKFAGCLWVTAAALALAQDAPPAPPEAPAPPAPASAPAPTAAPAAPQAEIRLAKEAPAAKTPKAIFVNGDQVFNLEDWDQFADMSDWKLDSKALSDQIKAATKMSVDAGQLGKEISDAVKAGKWEFASELGQEIAAKALAQSKAYQDSAQLYAQAAPMPPMPPRPPQPMFTPQPGRGVNGGITFGQNGRAMTLGRAAGEDRIFSVGENNLDNHNLDNALVNFNEVISRGGSRADGATYYKAFTLLKMGRKDEAQNALNELRKSYASSRWLGDASALEADLKSGKSSSDEDDIKVMAVDGLMQSDPEKAFPILEGLIKGAHIPRLKREAVMVLAKNNSPRAQTLLEQIARGTVGDPDQQLAALRYVVDIKSNPARAQLLMDVYNGAANDTSVRNMVIQTFRNNNDFAHLGDIIKTEKNPELRNQVMNRLGDEDGQPQLWAIYSSQTTPEDKRNVLGFMHTNGNVDKLAEVARTDKDATVRKAADYALGSMVSSKAPNVATTLVTIYGNETDMAPKKQIVSDLAEHKDAKSLIEVYRKEKDVEMRRFIMGRIVNIHSPEVNDFFMEILK